MVKPASWLPAAQRRFVMRKPWLSVTPEPERELPRAVATLIHGGSPPAGAVAAEQARIERLVLRGRQRAWLTYLHRVVELIESRAGDTDPEVSSARARASAVISNHHNLLLGLSERGARLSAADRIKLMQPIDHDSQARGHT